MIRPPLYLSANRFNEGGFVYQGKHMALANPYNPVGRSPNLYLTHSDRSGQFVAFNVDGWMVSVPWSPTVTDADVEATLLAYVVGRLTDHSMPSVKLYSDRTLFVVLDNSMANPPHDFSYGGHPWYRVETLALFDLLAGFSGVTVISDILISLTYNNRFWLIQNALGSDDWLTWAGEDREGVICRGYTDPYSLWPNAPKPAPQVVYQERPKRKYTRKAKPAVATVDVQPTLPEVDGDLEEMRGHTV